MILPLNGRSSVTDKARKVLLRLRMQRKLSELAPRTSGVTLVDVNDIPADEIPAIQAEASRLSRMSQAERHAFSNALVTPQHDTRYRAPGSPLTPFRVDAKEDIACYKLLGVYEGKMKTVAEAGDEQEQLKLNAGRVTTMDYLFDLLKLRKVPRLCVDAGPIGGPGGIPQRGHLGALFNSPDPGGSANIIALNAVAAGTNMFHTNNPRIERIPILLLVTCRHIKQGEEVLLSYGSDYWKEKESLLEQAAKVKAEKVAATGGEEAAAAHGLAPLGAAPQDGVPAAGAHGGNAAAGAYGRGAARASRLRAPQQAGEGGAPGGDPDDEEDDGMGSDSGRGRRGNKANRGPCSIYVLAERYPELAEHVERCQINGAYACKA